MWAPRQERSPVVALTYEWRYLALGVDRDSGQLWWTWLPNMQQAAIRRVVEG